MAFPADPLIFNSIREHLAVTCDVNWATAVVMALIVDRDVWTPNADDAFVDDALGAGAIETSGTRQQIANPVAALSGADDCVYWDGDPIVYPGVLVAETFDTLILYVEITDDTDSYLIGAYDLGAQTGDGANVTIAPDTKGHVKW